MLNLAYLIAYIFFVLQHVLSWVLGTDPVLQQFSFLFPIFSLISIFFIFLSGVGFAFRFEQIDLKQQPLHSKQIFNLIAFLFIIDAFRHALIFGVPYIFEWSVIQMIGLSLYVIYLLSSRNVYLLGFFTLFVFLSKNSVNVALRPLFEAANDDFLLHPLFFNSLLISLITFVFFFTTLKIVRIKTAIHKKLNLLLLLSGLWIFICNQISTLPPLNPTEYSLVKNFIWGALATDPNNQHSYSFFVWFPIVSCGFLFGYLYKRWPFFKNHLGTYALVGSIGLLIMNFLFYIQEKDRFKDLIAYSRETSLDDIWGHHILSFLFVAGPIIWFSKKFENKSNFFVNFGDKIRRGMYFAFFGITVIGPKICFDLKNHFGVQSAVFGGSFLLILLGYFSILFFELFTRKKFVVRLVKVGNKTS